MNSKAQHLLGMCVDVLLHPLDGSRNCASLSSADVITWTESQELQARRKRITFRRHQQFMQRGVLTGMWWTYLLFRWRNPTTSCSSYREEREREREREREMWECILFFIFQKKERRKRNGAWISQKTSISREEDTNLITDHLKIFPLKLMKKNHGLQEGSADISIQIQVDQEQKTFSFLATSIRMTKR